MKLVTDFDIDDKIYLPEIERPGVVDSIFISRQGIRYCVRYFSEGKLQEVYFTADEIEKKKP